MQTYAKLTAGGALQRLTRHPYISNATAEQLAEYAAAQGYKPLQVEPCPAAAIPAPEGEDAACLGDPSRRIEEKPEASSPEGGREAGAWLPVYTETPEGIVQSWKQEGE